MNNIKQSEMSAEQTIATEDTISVTANAQIVYSNNDDNDTIMTQQASQSDADDADDHWQAGKSWQGWSELENDPLIFTKLLKDWGIMNVKVDEVIPLDSILEIPSERVLGLIFLSRWTAPEEELPTSELPDHLWFANQISTFSCATLALMNIITNVQGLELGQQILDFKDSTADLSPKDRGKALDEFQFVKDIHNSFSRSLDHMIVDLKLKEDYQAATKRRAPRKGRKRKKTKDLYTDEDESGLHFVAYIASRGDVWKLDGIEALPRKLGSYEKGENWLFTTTADIQNQLDGPDANDLEFSLLSLTHESDSALDPVDETRVERMKEDWSPFFAHMLKLHAQRGDVENMVSW